MYLLRSTAIIAAIFYLQPLLSNGSETFVDQTSKDNRPYLTRASDFVEAVLGEMTEVGLKNFHSYAHDFPSQCPSSVENAQGLLIMIHGLNSYPAQWWRYRDLSESLADWSFFVPEVKDKGNCYLDEAVEPILSSVDSFLKNNPHKPIVIMGTSNGGRIALELLNRIRQKYPNDARRILVVSLSGAILGSKTLEMAQSIGIATSIKPKAICDEMMPDSSRVQKLMHDAQYSFSHTNTDGLFISIPTEVEFPIGSSMLTAPNFGDVLSEVRYVLLRATGHSGVVSNSYPVVRQILMDWIQNKSIVESDLSNFDLVLPSAHRFIPWRLAMVSSVVTLYLAQRLRAHFN